MFKEDGRTWLYLVGIIVMFIILILITGNFLFPFFYGESAFDINGKVSKIPEFTINTNTDYLAKFTTNLGEFTVDLYEKNSPNNVNNFIYLANINYYSKTTFFRLIPNLLIQGGSRNTLNDDPLDDSKGSPGYVLNDEINWESLNFSESKKNSLQSEGYSNSINLESKPLEYGTFAMANAGPNTNGSQFFFNLAPSSDTRILQMNGKFTTIGKIISGEAILNIFSNIAVDNPTLKSPTPLTPIILEKIEIYTK